MTTETGWREPAAQSVGEDRMARIDELVERARGAADAFRRLDQAAVDRIVLTMTEAGLDPVLIGIAHGRANAVFLPYVLRYNASLPTKFMPAPGYSAYVAPEKYAQLGYVIFGGHTDEERRQRLFRAVDDLLETVGEPRTLKEAGVPESEFERALPDLARLAFADPSLRTNPRMPLVNELVALLLAAYHGTPAGV